MPTNDFRPIAADPGANVVSQAAYLALLAPSGALEDGFESGIAVSEQFNKVMRQSSVIAHTVAQFISDTLGADVLDDGDLATLLAQFVQAIETVASVGGGTTGDIKMTIKTVADTGWIMMDDGTIGDATSGADYANADAEDLFLLIWNNISDTWAPVVGGRGGSAAADWAAHKRITLPRVLGRALAVAGSGSGLTARALGEYDGSETTTLATANLPAHNHPVNDPGHGHGYNSASFPSGSFQFAGGVGWEAAGGVTATSTTGITTGNTGSGTAFETLSPESFFNVMIKL